MGSKLTPERKTAFLAALAETASVTSAAKAVGLCRLTLYNWRDDDEEFAKAWDKAMKLGVLAMEDECKRRAFEGFERPVFYEGQECGSMTQYSDTLAIFLMKAHDPERFRERSNLELTGAGGGPVQTQSNMSDAQIAQSLNALNARKAAPETEEDDKDVSDLV